MRYSKRRQGREKLHFLNAVPIRLIHDRWVNKFTTPGSLRWMQGSQENLSEVASRRE